MTDSEIVAECDAIRGAYSDWCLKVFEYNMDEAGFLLNAISNDLRKRTRAIQLELNARNRRMEWEGR